MLEFTQALFDKLTPKNKHKKLPAEEQEQIATHSSSTSLSSKLRGHSLKLQQLLESLPMFSKQLRVLYRR